LIGRVLEQNRSRIGINGFGRIGRAEERQIKSDPRVNRIVVAIDLSDHSIKTTQYALALAKHFCASLTLVHVFEPEEITFTAPQVGEDYETARHYAELPFLGQFEGTNYTKVL
jgi:universal stress protein family protein